MANEQTPGAWRCPKCGMVDPDPTAQCVSCLTDNVVGDENAWQPCYFRGGVRAAEPIVAMLRASTTVRHGGWIDGAPSHILAEYYSALRAIGWDVVPAGPTPLLDSALAALSAYVGEQYQRRGELEGVEAKQAVRRAFFELKTIQRTMMSWRRELTAIADAIEPGRLASVALLHWMAEYEQMWEALEKIADGIEDPSETARAIVEETPRTHARDPKDRPKKPEIEP